MPKFIDIDSIEDGMVLALTIENSFGQVILPENAILSKKHINVLKGFGIGGVQIIDESDKEIDFDINSIDNDILNKVKEQLKSIMQWSPRNKNEDDIYQMALIFRASGKKI